MGYMANWTYLTRVDRMLLGEFSILHFNVARVGRFDAANLWNHVCENRQEFPVSAQLTRQQFLWRLTRFANALGWWERQSINSY